MVEHFGLCAGNLNCTGSRNFQIAPVGNYAACAGIKMTSKKDFTYTSTPKNAHVQNKWCGV